MSIERFERAFTSGGSGCRRQCHCGKEFYDYTDRGCFDEGELEKLESNKNACAVDYSVGTVIFEGKEYVMDCDCWHARAKSIMGFIESHDRQIADYLNQRKKDAVKEANSLPEV